MAHIFSILNVTILQCLSIKISEVLNKDWFLTLGLQGLLKVLQTDFMASCFTHYYSKQWRQKFKLRNWDRMFYFQIYSEVDYNFHFKSSSFLAHVHHQRIHSFEVEFYEAKLREFLKRNKKDKSIYFFQATLFKQVFLACLYLPRIKYQRWLLQEHESNQFIWTKKMKSDFLHHESKSHWCDNERTVLSKRFQDRQWL